MHFDYKRLASSFKLTAHLPILHKSLQLARHSLFKKKIYKPIKLRAKEAYVSFCFDDVHSTAFENGQIILDDFQIRATFYLSLSFLLSGKNTRSEPRFSIKQLEFAHNSGHELACHTFSHLDVNKIESLDKLSDNINKNRQAIEDLPISLNKFKNFAYPYGRVNLGYKNYLSTQFSTCRGTDIGINTQVIDADYLKAVPLYENIIDLKKINALLKETENGGWLIFYTHDVQTHFSNYGCSPFFLQSVITLCLQHKVRISSMEEVLSDIEK